MYFRRSSGKIQLTRNVTPPLSNRLPTYKNESFPHFGLIEVRVPAIQGCRFVV